MTEEITYPTIHLNGNSKDRLQGQYENALDKVRDAIVAVRDIQFHSRDYYPQGDEAFPKAQEQLLAHLVRPIHGAESYLEKVTINISQQ